MVYDYKGGELSSNINMSREGLCNELSERFEGVEGTDEKKVLKALKKIEGDEDFYSTYAGWGSFCGKIYKIENNKMTEISLKSLLPDIAKILVKYNLEYEEV